MKLLKPENEHELCASENNYGYFGWAHNYLIKLSMCASQQTGAMLHFEKKKMLSTTLWSYRANPRVLSRLDFHFICSQYVGRWSFKLNTRASTASTFPLLFSLFAIFQVGSISDILSVETFVVHHSSYSSIMRGRQKVDDLHVAEMLHETHKMLPRINCVETTFP
jgi:hypothetical protein